MWVGRWAPLNSLPLPLSSTNLPASLLLLLQPLTIPGTLFWPEVANWDSPNSVLAPPQL